MSKKLCNKICACIVIIMWIAFIIITIRVRHENNTYYAQVTETTQQDIYIPETAKIDIQKNETDTVQSCEVQPTYWMSTDEYELFAKCVEAEAGTEGFVGKQYVVDVILNRVDSDKYPNTIKDVILQKHQFEVVDNGRIYDIVPTDETYRAINTELEGQLDNEITLFRMSYYHPFGTPKFHYKNHYFSVD